MSITFRPAADTNGLPLLRCICDEGTCAACAATVNYANANATELLRWLGLVPSTWGVIRAVELAHLCEAGIPLPEEDLAVPTTQIDKRTIICGRPAGRLRERVEGLLKVARLAGDWFVVWE